jgi:Transposase DDE domain
MKGMTNYITEAKWEDVFLVWYVLIDEAYQKLEEKYGEWRRSGPAPVFSDSEVITVAMIIDTYFHGHEALGLSFLRQYHAELFPHLPSDGHFNERRTRLGPLIEQIRCWLTKQEGLLDEADRVRLIDSAPIFVATYGRGGDNQTLAGHEYFGVATSHGAKVFGLRLDVTTSHDQVIDQWMLAPASLHDSTTMPALVEEQNNLLLIGDGAYHNPTIEPVMSKNHQIIVLAPPRQDSRLETWSKETFQAVARFRRPVESAFSVLTTVFDIEHPLAHSLHGLVSRLATRILAYTCSFVMNKYLALLTG